MKARFHQLLAATRFLIIIPILGTFLSGIALMVYGIKQVYVVSLQLFVPSEKELKVIVDFVKVIDVFLLSVAFYIIALGLYELFIDGSMKLPDWLTIKDFDSLKSKLLDVVAVILGVSFLGNISTWNGEWEIVGLGISIFVVMIGIKIYVKKD